MTFDKQAKEWDNDPQKVERAEVFAKEIVDFIKPKRQMNALEFGCGTGLLSFKLKDDFNNITLTDTSGSMIDVLKEKISKGGLNNFVPYKTDLLKDEINFSNIDVIYTSMTLHHIIDLKAILNKFKSVLNPNGYLCIADLVKEDGSFHSHIANFDGHNGFDRNELSKILSKSGFKVEYYNECYTIRKQKEDKIVEYPLFIMICKVL